MKGDEGKVDREGEKERKRERKEERKRQKREKGGINVEIGLLI